MAVEVVEVSDDDRYGQRYSQNAGDDAQRADQFAPDTDGVDVAVADRRHRHDRPPERARDRLDLRALLAGLGVVRDRAEDDHGDQQEEEEHSELVETGLDRHAENAQTLRAVQYQVCTNQPPKANSAFHPSAVSK